ncbi:hypothetical protein [Tepidibacter formicigenes]|jgi:phenylacetate-coenzyme A ligase PaaK-like adenylate-forming protein|uniref:Uncharacterized protein n=1 Tax=Tepidibacter formicigenes DSM 15518 TaxID=1123349 RepID=A0A1M6QS43_9FIRM|nr:hypothetical protein [Tepidibacter formicigenes]SHK22837.1 hypothetical protein SAMN02744037_01932 [Tepidibacter formicigenes DSM 15518]
MSIKIHFIDGNSLILKKNELSRDQVKQILTWFEEENSPLIRFTVGDLTHNLPRHAIYNIITEY